MWQDWWIEKDFQIKRLIISKKPWFTGVQAGFQAEFTTNLRLLRERALICRPESCKLQYQYDIERINENWIRHRHGVSLSHNRENGNAALYTLMLRDRSKKRLATNGFAGVFLPEIRIYAYPRQNGILLRNIPTAKGVLKLWLFSKRTSTDIARYWEPDTG